MSDWGASEFGSPCGMCGYSWAIAPAGAVEIISASPERYRRAVAGGDGTESTTEVDWNVAGYVAHVGDNLRIWSERIAAAGATDEPLRIEPYDADLLATARRYDSLPLESALWSLGQSVGSWLIAVRGSPVERMFVHPDRGVISVADVVITNGHDVTHHLVDIARCRSRVGLP